MRQAARAIELSVEQLPDEPCSASKNPRPLVALVDACRTLIDLCGPHIEAALGSEEEPEAEPLPPVRELLSLKERLLAVASAHAGKLSLRYSTYRFSAGGERDRRDYRPAELISIAAAHLELAAYGALPDRDSLPLRRADDLPHVARNEIATCDAPVLSYSVVQAFDALTHLGKKMISVTFSNDLIDYRASRRLPRAD